MPGDQVADQRHDARDDLVLVVVAVREEGVVCDLDIAGIGVRFHDLAQHGEAAEAGIDHEDGLNACHAEILGRTGYHGVVMGRCRSVRWLRTGTIL